MSLIIVVAIWCFFQVLAPLFYLGVEIVSRTSNRISLIWTISVSLPILVLTAAAIYAASLMPGMDSVSAQDDFRAVFGQLALGALKLAVWWSAAVCMVSLLAVSLAWASRWKVANFAEDLRNRRIIAVALSYVATAIVLFLLFENFDYSATGTALVGFVVAGIFGWQHLMQSPNTNASETASPRSKLANETEAEATLFGADLAPMRFINRIVITAFFSVPYAQAMSAMYHVIGTHEPEGLGLAVVGSSLPHNWSEPESRSEADGTDVQAG
jgi:hypothetical protein